MDSMNILFTSAGRRVSLIRSFRHALEQLGCAGRLLTSDTGCDAPARFAGDGHIQVPCVDSPEYIRTLADICAAERISLVVPLIDPELGILAPQRERFREQGTTLLVSSPSVADITFDKRSTADFFESIGVDSPKMLTELKEADLPVFIKPAKGSGSVGANLVEDMHLLEFYKQITNDPIVQEYVDGIEYTIDVLVDGKGRARSVVPRRRIATRAGEVSKGVTEKSPEIIATAVRIAEALPGAFGPITLQCFKAVDGRLVFIEINPRFGGGFPLSHAAGADFPRWIIQWIKGQDPAIDLDDWQDNLLMTRYDDAFFVDYGDVQE